MDFLFTTAYWPNLHYFFYVLKSNSVRIEQYENYQKQSFRNRTQILSANGVLDLSIPVNKRNIKETTRDIQISYKENWQIKHWRAITSAYKNSPYFEFFEEDIKPFYKEKYELLLEYNEAQLILILKILKLQKRIQRSVVYQKTTEELIDLREIIHPKKENNQNKKLTTILNTPYYQTFGAKHGFTPNLSILDLLFNKGLGTIDYLKEK